MSAAHRFPLVCLSLGFFALSARAGPIRPGFDAAILPTGDDVSSGAADLGFAVNFFGQTFHSLYVNNNGNLTFDRPLPDFTPVPLGQLRAAVVAPFFADVDTTAAGVVTYGTGTADGRPAFGVTWRGVGFNGGTGTTTNDFQAVLIDRSDTGAGNFDAEFNYGRVGWESGNFNGGVDGKGGSTARVGVSAGTGAPGSFYELPGSGVPGTFLDNADQTALARAMLNTDTPGRLVLASRGGEFVGLAQPSPADDLAPAVGDVSAGVVGTPEPGTLALGMIGAAALVVRARGGKRTAEQNLARPGRRRATSKGGPGTERPPCDSPCGPSWRTSTTPSTRPAPGRSARRSRRTRRPRS